MASVALGVVLGVAQLAGCGGATAPPQVGYQIACYAEREGHCGHKGQEHWACGEYAPSGFYWEALPPRKVESAPGNNCYFVLKRMDLDGRGNVAPGYADPTHTPGAPYNATSPPPPAPAPGCRNDTECKGDRICENGQCVSPDATKPTGTPCARDTDCPENDICEDGHCTAPPASSAPPGGAGPTD